MNTRTKIRLTAIALGALALTILLIFFYLVTTGRGAV